MATVQNTFDGSPSSTDTGSDEYGTPREYIDRFTKYVTFDLDPAAGAERRPVASIRYTKEDDGLSKRWCLPDVDSIWLNPPYSDPEPFLAKLVDAVDPDDPLKANVGIAVTRCDTSTGWFQNHMSSATALWFENDRVSFDGASNDAGFACIFGLFGDVPDELLRDLSQDGLIYTNAEITRATEQSQLDEMLAESTAGTAIQTTDNDTGPDLSFVHPRDNLWITFSGNELVGNNPPEKALIEVLPDGKTVTAGGEVVEVDAIGTTSDGTDVCAQIKSTPNQLQPIEVSLAVGKDHWQQVTPTEVTVV